MPELDLADSRSSIPDIADVSIPPFRRMDDSNLAAYMKDSGGNVVVAGYVGFQYICNGKFHHASLTFVETAPSNLASYCSTARCEEGANG